MYRKLIGHKNELFEFVYLICHVFSKYIIFEKNANFIEEQNKLNIFLSFGFLYCCTKRTWFILNNTITSLEAL